MNSILLNKKKCIDINKINSAVYKHLSNYSEALDGNAIVYSEFNSHLILVLRVADMLGRKLVIKNFEKSYSQRKLFRHLDYYHLFRDLLQVISLTNRYSMMYFGFKWAVVLKSIKASPYATAVINTIHNQSQLLACVSVIRSQNLSFMGVKGGTIQRIKGADNLMKVLIEINHLLRQNANKPTNNFDQYIIRTHTRYLAYLNQLLTENNRLNFVRVFLPIAFEPNISDATKSDRLKEKIRKFHNCFRNKTSIFGGCVGHIKGNVFKWGLLVGIEFIFLFKIQNHNFNFYKRQREILKYWFDYLKLDLEKRLPIYCLQPFYAKIFNVHSVLDQKNETGVLDFVIKNVLPVKLAYLFYKVDFAPRINCEDVLDAEQHTGGRNELLQTT